MCLCFLPLFKCNAQADSTGSTPAYADKLFDNSYVHRIDVRMTDGDWTELLADPISKTKYAADIVIDGETFSNVSFSTKGFSSLYFVAYGEEESRRYSFKVNFGKLVEGQTYYGLDRLSLNCLFCDNNSLRNDERVPHYQNGEYPEAIGGRIVHCQRRTG